jgi:hypothetical protein
MPVDAFIHLDRLRCLAESDGSGHSEPYVWTMLLWVDDTTIGSDQSVGSSAPGNVRGSRAVIKEGIKVGEQADMPSVQRSFAHRFEDDLSIRNVGIVVAMFEEDETPGDAVRAAYSAFVRELPKAAADFIRTNSRAPETDDECEEIANQVRPKVREAGKNALSSFEKVQLFLGTLDLDDEIGFDTWFTEIDDQDTSPRPFTLRFEKTVTVNVLGQELTISNHYEIDGRFELRQPPAPDPCQDEVDRVRQARAVVDGHQAATRASQAELREALPSQKPGIIREIRRIREEDLPPAVAAFEAAQRALALCRA